MKIKSIIGILLIAASVVGMYFWESTYREKLIEYEIQIDEEKNSAEESEEKETSHYSSDGSYTLYIPSSWIYLKNAELKAGDPVEIYLVPEKLYLGKYIVKLVDKEKDKYVEIQCSLEDYFNMLDLLGEDEDRKLLLVSGYSL